MFPIESILSRIKAFSIEAHSILAIHEASTSPVVLLEGSYSKLSGLSLQQDELFRQALRCVENELFRAAHVMAWSGFIDFVHEKLESNNFQKLRATRPKWNFVTIEDLRDQYTDFAIIEASKGCVLFSKVEMKAFHGLLAKRNECAHPSSFFPGLNESLGYISELLKRVDNLQSKPF